MREKCQVMKPGGGAGAGGFGRTRLTEAKLGARNGRKVTFVNYTTDRFQKNVVRHEPVSNSSHLNLNLRTTFV